MQGIDKPYYFNYYKELIEKDCAFSHLTKLFPISEKF